MVYGTKIVVYLATNNESRFKRLYPNPSHKYSMRFYEFSTKPLTPEQSRINGLKQRKDSAATALAAERTRQKRAKARERVQKAQQALAKTNIPSV